MMDLKKFGLVAAASALAVAPVSAQTAQETRGTGPGAVQYALGAAFAALILYGIYDVLIEDEEDTERPVSP